MRPGMIRGKKVSHQIAFNLTQGKRGCDVLGAAFQIRSNISRQFAPKLFIERTPKAFDLPFGTGQIGRGKDQSDPQIGRNLFQMPGCEITVPVQMQLLWNSTHWGMVHEVVKL